MRVLFIYPDVGTLLPPEYQHGVGILISLLKRAGHTCELFYVHDEPRRDEFIARVKEFNPGLIAFSTATNQFPRARELARWIKAEVKAPIAIGGVHATLAAAETIAEPCFDLLCRGEGEDALLELVAAMEAGRDFSAIPNWWIKRGNEVIKNELRPLVADLDSLPFADREAFRYEWILREQNGRASLLSGRGCPFGCTYCANLGLRALYKGLGKYVRMRSPQNLLAEMRAIRDRYEVKKWDFNDDVFTLNREWVQEFCELYHRECKLPFDVNVRVETVDREMLAALKAAGCEWIRVGVESGSDRVRKEIMGRSMPAERIVKVFDDARAVGLKAWSFNMVGLPGETEADALETYRLNERLCPDHMQVSVFNPYPGTALHDECVKRGVIAGEARAGYFVPESTLALPEFPAEKIHEMHQRLWRLRDRCHSVNKLRRELGGEPAVDFVSLLDRAEIAAPEPSYVGEDFFTIGGDTRRVLMVHPPSKVTFKVRAPKGGVLRADLALHPQIWGREGGGGVEFIVRAGRFKRWIKEIFRQTIDPKGNPADRRWHEVRLPLGSLAGKSVFIQFETRTVDPARPEHNTAGFGFAVLTGSGG